MALDNNSFCWNGVVTTNADGAKDFYRSVIGWEAMEHTFPSGETTTMLAAAGFPRAHLRAPEGGESPRWATYLRVEDVDAATEAAATNGGSVMIPPTDIDPGRFSAVTAPSGALLCLYHEADEEAAMNAPGGEGSRHWTELHSEDRDADVAWLKTTFGFEVEKMPVPDVEYFILNSGGQPRGGVCSSFKAEVAGQWLNWVEVSDTDAAIGRARDAGGEAVTEASDYPGVGRMAILKDPTGAVFGVITPTPSPSG